MSMSMHRETPGPILDTYAVPNRLIGGMLSKTGDVWLLSFGGFGRAFAVGWVCKKARFEDATYTVGRPR